MPSLYMSRPGGFDIRPAHQTAATPINDFIYLSEGLSNSYLVVTSAGRVVINTGMGFEAPVHKRLYDAIDQRPIRYILLTQGHVDHVGGVDVLREAGTEIVAHRNNQAHQADDARIQPFRTSRSRFAFADAIARKAQPLHDGSGGIPVQSHPQPTITFEDRYDFELGGVRFELLSTPGGETTDSMVIWLPQYGICFTGNLFSALFGHFPNLVTIRGDRYREALKFIDSLDRVRALEPETLLVGHHGPVRGRDVIRAELLRLRGAVEYVHEAVVNGMNAGKDVHTLMREIVLPPELDVGQGYGKVSWSVRAIWETYAGWFHQHSTTELYPVPYWSIDADVVELAGGPDPIAARAARKVEQARPLEAIHLAEVVLTAVPTHRGALDASRAAHGHLLEHSENFWETKWLQSQIAQLDRGLTSAPPGDRPAEIRISDLAAPVLSAAQKAAIDAASRVPVRLTEEAVLAEAVRRTGLTDFGPDDFRERLRVQLQSLEEDPHMGPVGHVRAFGDCVRYAANRLRLEDFVRRHPELLDVEIKRPIIIVGLPRSGTTHLLNLISSDTRLRSLPYWESLEPVPAAREGPGRDGLDPRFGRCREGYERSCQLLPLLRNMHDMPPQHIHEENELQAPDFSNYNLEWTSYVPRWRDYYLAHDQTPHYRYLKKALQVLQWQRGPDRWILKSPQHLEQLVPLLKTFPDATIAFTHRDPVSVIASTVTMYAYASRVRCTRVDLGAIAAYWIDRIERLLRACVRDRDLIPASQSIDVLFHEFMADDVGTVERIYARADLEMTPETRRALDAFVAENPRGKYGRVIYDLKTDFGIDPATLRQRFAFYFERFPVKAED